MKYGNSKTKRAPMKKAPRKSSHKSGQMSKAVGQSKLYRMTGKA